jgi:hypothetical protein
MVAVAVSACLMGIYRVLPSFRDFVDFFTDDPFHAIRMVKKSWNAGPSPSITVDLFEGSIQVVPSKDGLITAEVTTSAVTKQTQSVADRAIDTIDLSFNHMGDSLRIKAGGASEPGIKKTADLKLYVPSGVDLDLRTGRGCIYVGRDYIKGVPVHVPIVARSIRARNDSDYMLGYAQGNIVVESLAPSPSGASPIPTRLQLDAPGQIEIIADLAVVDASARHGIPPSQWSPGAYEDEVEGSITFEGILATGAHSLRAAHRITMKLPESSSLLIDAEAVDGKIAGNLLPGTIEPSGGKAIWKGSVGIEPRANLRVRTDDGPVELNTKQ